MPPRETATTVAGSISSRMRSRRRRRFLEMLAGRSVRLLDIGGTNRFWESWGLAGDPRISITLLNQAPDEGHHPNITSVVGAATDVWQFENGSFDIVFSNSTIEHLFTFDAQQAMAREVRRLAPSYYVQTPNFWFPIEPHFLTLGWQYLPTRVRVEILRRRSMGLRGRTPDPAAARRVVEEIRLLRPSEMRLLFPDAELWRERVGPLVKSLVAIRSAR